VWICDSGIFRYARDWPIPRDLLESEQARPALPSCFPIGLRALSAEPRRRAARTRASRETSGPCWRGGGVGGFERGVSCCRWPLACWLRRAVFLLVTLCPSHINTTTTSSPPSAPAHTTNPHTCYSSYSKTLSSPGHDTSTSATLRPLKRPPDSRPAALGPALELPDTQS